MTISLDPNPFGLLSWTALAAVAGALAGGALFLLQAGRLGARRRTLYDVTLAALLCALLGARLFHIADYYDFYAKSPFQMLYLWNGGLSLWGGVLGGLAGGLWRIRRHGLPADAALAAATMPALVGLALGRAGDFLAGERAATTTSAPWGVVYANERAEAYASYTSDDAVHPVALYEMLLDLAIAGAVATWGRRIPERAVMPAALAAWAAGRFLIALARVDPAHLGLQQTQWLSLLVLTALAAAALRAHLQK